MSTSYPVTSVEKILNAPRNTRYVSAVHVPSFSPSSLLSGGGDPSIKLWDWMSGEQLADIPIGDIVEKYIKVKAPKARFGRGEDGDDEGQPSSENQGRRKNKKRNGRGKGKQPIQEEAEGDEQAAAYGEGETEETSHNTPEETAVPSARDEAVVATEAEEDKLVLALRRIDSLNVPDAGNFVVFSAVGYVFFLLWFIATVINLSTVLLHCSSSNFPLCQRRNLKLPSKRSISENLLWILHLVITVIFGCLLTANIKPALCLKMLLKINTL